MSPRTKKENTRSTKTKIVKRIRSIRGTSTATKIGVKTKTKIKIKTKTERRRIKAGIMILVVATLRNIMTRSVLFFLFSVSCSSSNNLPF